MKKNVKVNVTIVAIIFLFMTISVAKAQLTVTTGQTAQFYVENILLTGSVFIQNVNYTGSPHAIGHFTTGTNPTNLGLTEGIVLSTGMVNGTPAIGSPVSGFASTNLSFPGDPLLNTLIPNYTTNDAMILEFDFISLSDTILFRYVFASEEYPEWVGSSFNDVFGFFVSGPNPLGGNYLNYNIARIPGTTVPVAINNVHSASFSQYYVDNQALNGQTIVFDGFTTVIEARLVVVPCVSYHVKIAIADAGDYIYDSAVFLESYSFTSSGTSSLIPITINANSPVCPGDMIQLHASGGTSYTWSGPDGYTSSQQNPVITNAQLSNAGQYTVFVQNIDGCNIESVNVEVFAYDTLPSFCYVNYDIPSEKNIVYWDLQHAYFFDSVKIFRETALDVWTELATVAYNTPGFIDAGSMPGLEAHSYKVTGIDICNFESELLKNPHTSIHFHLDYDQVTDTYSFAWTPYGGINVNNYILYGVDTSGTYIEIVVLPGNVLSCSYQNPDPYLVTYFVGFHAQDCYSTTPVLITSNFVNTAFVNITETYVHKLNMYPNPAETHLYLHFFLPKSELVTAGIYELTGRLVSALNLSDLPAGEQILCLDTNYLAGGMYIVRLEIGEVIISRLFVISGK